MCNVRDDVIAADFPMNRLLPGLLLAITLLAPNAFAQDGAMRDPKSRHHLRFINRGDIFTLDLNQMSYMQDFRLTYAIREGLYAATGPDFTPVPAGATGVDVSADKCVYTFHLRPEAKWSNGDPVTAHDYVFSWFRLLEDPGEYTYLFYCIKGAEEYEKSIKSLLPLATPDRRGVGIEAVDDLTFRVTLRQPLTYMTDLVAFPTFYPRHEKSMEAFAIYEDPVNRKGRILTYRNQYTRPPKVVTNGPFNLVDWKFKRVLKLEKNAHYWDAANVKLDSIDNIVNENTLSQYLQFKAGAADWIAEVPPDIAPELRAQGVKELQSATAFGTAFLTVYCKPELPKSVLGGAKNPMADVRVRQAMALAIDKQFIAEHITRMGEKIATTYIPPGTLPGFTSLPGMPMDVKRAQQLLADAGYPNGQGFPKLPILYNAENATRAKIAQALQQQWKQNLGIDVEIEAIEGKIFRERVSTKQYAIATVAWFGDYPDVSTFTDKYRATSLQNDSAWETPAYDALLNAAALETDPPKRFAILAKAEAMLNTEFPIIPLYHYVNTGLISDRVSGLTVNARMMIRWKEVDVQP